MKVLMLAAENGAFPGGKVGGIGDVVRDVPKALAARGHEVDVLMPGYMHFSTLPGAHRVAAVKVRFRGRPETLELYQLTAAKAQKGVRHWVLEHPGFAPDGPGRIYCDDADGNPFATDSSKFALFSVAAAQSAVSGAIAEHDILHLHDWHAALVALLGAYHPAYRAILKKRITFTIHNLSLQGIRPFRGHDASLESWFPELKYQAERIRDPRYADCYNPMRAAINLSHRVHAVSPTYAKEIQQPSQVDQGFVGGEGLERDLRSAANEKRLEGILNGCDYPRSGLAQIKLKKLLTTARSQVVRWLGRDEHAASSAVIALERIREWESRKRSQIDLVVTSVGRLTEQKAQLLRQPLESGQTGIERVLQQLKDCNGVLLLLGTGDSGLERFFTDVAARHDNFLFLRGYSDELAADFYRCGDLFLMPSSFEPCGISQMLAMRSGQPCLVHGVGGLVDTVTDNKTGFVFTGDSPSDQAKAMLKRLDQAVALKSDDPKQWQAICDHAKLARFSWAAVAEEYERKLYR